MKKYTMSMPAHGWLLTGMLLGAVSCSCLLGVGYAVATTSPTVEVQASDISVEETIPFEFEAAIVEPEPAEAPEYERYLPKKSEPEWVCPISDDEVWLLGLVCVAESEDQSEEGKRLVIDTVLNRVESDEFPDTIEDVVYQKSQFSSMWNGRADRCVVTDEYRDLVMSELKERTNSDVLYFRTGHYCSWGDPLFKVGDHYFSK